MYHAWPERAFSTLWAGGTLGEGISKQALVDLMAIRLTFTPNTDASLEQIET